MTEPGLQPGEPRYLHDPEEPDEEFVTRWGNYDMYYQPMICNCHAVLRIRHGSIPAQGLFKITMFSPTRESEWTFEHINQVVTRRDNRRRTNPESSEHVAIAKGAINAYNEFKRNKYSVGDAMERLA